MVGGGGGTGLFEGLLILLSHLENEPEHRELVKKITLSSHKGVLLSCDKSCKKLALKKLKNSFSSHQNATHLAITTKKSSIL